MRQLHPHLREIYRSGCSPDPSVALLRRQTFVFHLLSALTIIPDDSSLPQKRDIQLLKAYMRAIRSVNPNLQNLEETIEYNEILE